MKHIISMIMENESGALSRVAGLFSARGYNIHALTVAPTEDESMSRLTLVTSGTDQQIEQIVKHLNRLVDVIKVLDLTEGAHIERELMLLKLSATGANREEYKRLADIFRGDIIDVTPTTYTVQMVGESKKLDAFINSIDPGLILETVRSGTVGVLRGEKCLHI
jgi:acetolactate synthase-1/3 small subunit